MKKNLTLRESVSIASMLFGMFFGAGNLIFPAKMGQLAGWNAWIATIGMFVTGVGLPLLGVAALGISRSDGLQTLSSQVGKKYSYFFTCLLYLTIGPFFAIPRCATVPFTIGVTPLMGGQSSQLALAVFTTVFFALVLIFSLYPGRIMTWIGRILNPIFLVLLGILVVRALISPMGSVSDVAPQEEYATKPFIEGFLEGYNTMDALASLAFGIVVVNVIRQHGVKEPGDVARNTVISGISSCLCMGVIYLAITIVGTQSRAVYETCSNGGEVLALIAQHFFGTAGALVLAGIVTFACLKTAIGLITSCAETFSQMFRKGPSYRLWAIILCVAALLIANLGLDAIITYSVPVLMFLYPLAITLILLSLCGKLFEHNRAVYGWVTGFTLAAALLDFINSLPADLVSRLRMDGVIAFAKQYLPLYGFGLGWVCPAALGLIIGLIIWQTQKHKVKSAV